MMKETPLTLVGQQTPRAVVYKSESHKLCQAFAVKEGATIVKGQPVTLEADGSISPYSSTSTTPYLGIAITDSVYPAYQAQRNFPVEVTVMVEAFAIVNWVSSEADLPSGYVAPTSQLLNNRYVKAAKSTTATNFIALNSTTEENEVIQVLVK
jgi:hypothetical protein